MYLPRHTQTSSPRRGVILLVVLALLTLFAVVGVTFVLYSQRQADAARVYREAQILPSAVAPDVLLDEFLRQWIYDVEDLLPVTAGGTSLGPGVTSALRGHSLARTMFGQNPNMPTYNFSGNTAAYNGIGRLHGVFSGYPFTTLPVAQQDEYNHINYTYFKADGTTHDPEKSGWGTVWNGSAATARTWAAGFNPNYTYPDNNNMFLAAVDASGKVLQSSFHRDAIFGAADYTNGNWYGGTADLKYKCLRPRPAEHPLFPPPGLGGDVKNLLGAPGNNDSIWIDIGSPVRSLPDGRRYKALFAPLIVDLDNRINVNIHGNCRLSNTTHVSNMGIGPWEVNLEKVLYQQPSDSVTLLRGSGALKGRYGPNQQPDVSGAGNGGTLGTARFYGKYDYDGYDDTTSAASGQIQPPTGQTPFPTYPPGGYGNGSAAEMTNHPQLFNIFAPGNDDYLFPHSNLQALLRDASTNTEVAACELGKLSPTNFAQPIGNASDRIRRMITTLSYDLDHPGITPWAYTGAAPAYQLAGQVASGGPVAFPALPATWSDSTQALLGRVDLNRTLTDYATNAAQAQLDRQNLASDIYNRLAYVTGVNTAAAAGTADYDAMRWLAQLAVNIVDYLDEDDCMTPFNGWGAGTEYVFGTELPPVVINEAYCEYDNDPTDPKGDTKFNVNFWVELLNPMQDKAATLFGTTSIYRLEVAKTTDVAQIRDKANVMGDAKPGPVFMPSVDFTMAASVPTLGKLMVGPADLADGTTPDVNLPLKKDVTSVPAAETYAILLRRLACPSLAYDAVTNPYVTIDYVTGVQSYNGVKKVAGNANGAEDLPLTNRKSKGRAQPFAAENAQWADQTGGTGPKHTFKAANSNDAAVYNWLTHLDRKLVSPMEILQISGYKPHELTQQFIVGGNAYQHRPMSGGSLAWFDSSTRLYRVFEFLEGKSRAAGVAPTPVNVPPGPYTALTSRTPGKININTVWDFEIFRALCDAQTSNGNSFTAADVDTVFTALLSSRNGGAGSPTFSASDRPFAGMAAAYDTGGVGTQYPSGSSIESTLLRSGTAGRLFQGTTAGAGAHPYLQYELLNKIYNNVTTRSNCFVLYLTVGFFEVVDETVLPVRLGAEIDQNIGQNVRHRMFAVVDRSALTVDGNSIGATSNTAVTVPGSMTIALSAAVSTPSGTGIQPGQILTVDSGSNKETVIVTAVTNTPVGPPSAGQTTSQLTAKFNKTHATGFQILWTQPGHNGPRPTFGARDNNVLVPHYSIID